MTKRNWIERLSILLLIFNGLLAVFEIANLVHLPYRQIFLLLAILITAHAIYFTSPVSQLRVFLIFSMLGDELYFIAVPVLFFPRLIYSWVVPKKLYLKRAQVPVAIFLAYSGMVILVSYSFGFSFFNLLFWFLTFAGYWLIFCFYISVQFSSSDLESLFSFFWKLIALQIAVTLLQLPIHRDFRPGDSWTGTSGNSLTLGFFILTGLLFYLFSNFFNDKKLLTNIARTKVRDVVIGLVVLLVLYFNDSKMLILGFALGLILYPFFDLLVKLFKRFSLSIVKDIVGAFIVLLVASFVVAWATNLYIRKIYGEEMSVGALLSDYTKVELQKKGGNGKIVLLKRVYVDLLHDNPLVWTFGTGPGKFGSKAANTMAYDILYKLDDQNRLPTFITPYSSVLAREYMADLWTKEIVEMNKFRSANLAMPYAGLITIKGEYGLFGLLIFLYLVYSMSARLIDVSHHFSRRTIGYWARVISVFWFTLPFYMSFDNFQEKGSLLLPMLLLTAVLFSWQHYAGAHQSA